MQYPTNTATHAEHIKQGSDNMPLYSDVTLEQYEKLTPYQRSIVPMERKMELLNGSDEEGITLEDPREKIGDLTDDKLFEAMHGKHFGESDREYQDRLKRLKSATKKAKDLHVIPQPKW